jgi:hypothetical protein
VRVHDEHKRIRLVAEFTDGSFRSHKLEIFFGRSVSFKLLLAGLFSTSHANDTVPTKDLEVLKLFHQLVMSDSLLCEFGIEFNLRHGGVINYMALSVSQLN